MKDAKPRQLTTYPNVVKSLPEAEINVHGAKAWILKAEFSQLILFQFEPNTIVPGHSHAYPQWGMVIDGKMELTIAGTPLMCTKGTEYLIPACAKHSAKFLSKTRVMDYFSEKERYHSKKKESSSPTGLNSVL